MAATGGNLLDVVSVLKTEPAPKAKLDVLSGIIQETESASTFLRKYSSHRHLDDTTKEAFSRAKKIADDLRLELANNGYSLPEDLLDNSIPSRLATSPRASLKDLREICDTLGFVIIPFEYLSSKAYDNEGGDVLRAIDTFKSQTEEHGVSYVLCPPNFYDINRHVRAKNGNLPIYAGRNSAAFFAISMSVPMFRTILSEIEDNRKAIGNVQARVSAAEENIQSLANQLESLRNSVERERKRVALEKAAAEEVARRKEIEEARWLADEPLMFMVPGKSLLTEDVDVVLGPCWGPDFDAIVLAASGLKKKRGQRKKLDELIMQTWIPSRSTIYVDPYYTSGHYRY